MSATDHPFPLARSTNCINMRRAALPAIQLAMWLNLNCVGHAFSQTTGEPHPASPVVTDADMERVRREQVTPTDQDIERARRQYSTPLVNRLPADEPKGRNTVSSNTASIAQPTPAESRPSPDIGALPQPMATKPIDLGVIANAYATNPDGPLALQSSQKSPGLLIFISLAMPQPTLQHLVNQAARAQASLILRGLANGSLRDTVMQVQQLIGKQQASVQIDPQAFDRFTVARVPAFVLIRDGTRPASCASGTCAAPEAFVRAVGDVSLEYALEHMVRVAPTFQNDATPFLQRLRQPPQLQRTTN